MRVDIRDYGAVCNLVNDDGPALLRALAAAANSAGGSVVVIPYPGILVGSSFSAAIPQGVTISGDYEGMAIVGNVNPYVTKSASVFITSTTQIPFTFQTSGPQNIIEQSGIENLVLYWPGPRLPFCTHRRARHRSAARRELRDPSDRPRFGHRRDHGHP